MEIGKTGLYILDVISGARLDEEMAEYWWQRQWPVLVRGHFTAQPCFKRATEGWITRAQHEISKKISAEMKFDRSFANRTLASKAK
jgi:hypothetical protein